MLRNLHEAVDSKKYCNVHVLVIIVCCVDTTVHQMVLKPSVVNYIRHSFVVIWS